MSKSTCFVKLVNNLSTAKFQDIIEKLGYILKECEVEENKKETIIEKGKIHLLAVTKRKMQKETKICRQS